MIFSNFFKNQTKEIETKITDDIADFRFDLYPNPWSSVNTGDTETSL